MRPVVEERHLSINIQKWLKEAQDEYGISDNQLLTLTIDSAANMTKAIDMTRVVDTYIKKIDEEEQLEDFQEENDENIEEEEVYLSLHDEIDEVHEDIFRAPK